MNTIFKAPTGDIQLHRFPIQAKQSLQAWDAADEYLLQQLHSHNPSLKIKHVLVVNDAHGALCINLLRSYSDISISLINDSFLSQQGLEYNLAANKLDRNNMIHGNDIKTLNSLEGKFDLVIIKIQKSLAQLEDQLHKIRPHLHDDTIILAGGMVKVIHNSTIKLFDNIIGHTTSSLAQKKSRLIFSQLDKTLNPPNNPFPSRYSFPNSNEELLTHAGVFAQHTLDIGARFLIENLPKAKKYHQIIDLACGNGVLGISAAIAYPLANIYFCDESYPAVKSAKENFKAIIKNNKRGEFFTDDCLDTYPNNKADLILNNPPFHQQNTLDYRLADRMFRQSFSALKSGGELWVVGNRHLAYHKKLKNLFGNCEAIAANKKFVVLKSIKT